MLKNDNKVELDYRQAGVDIEKADAFIGSLKQMAQRTHRPEVLSGIGGFASLFEIPEGYQRPVLVSGTDGVGTKLKLATGLNRHDSIGIDLVAMCVNDVLTQGAEPLFFLDYFATGHLNPIQANAILKGIIEGCELAGASLVGGETAEMPGMYQGDDYDLAGFCVGIVEKSEIIDGSKVGPTDLLIGLASSGAHSNGYSLIRKILEANAISLDLDFEGTTLGEVLLKPTRIYVKSILDLIKKVPVHAMAHITGGGILDNLPRVLPPHIQAIVDTKSWERPALFDWLQSKASISETEMYRSFNMGIGMVLVVPSTNATETLTILESLGEKAWIIGHLEQSSNSNPEVVLT